jgi:outer membrane protein assembly factor BamE
VQGYNDLILLRRPLMTPTSSVYRLGACAFLMLSSLVLDACSSIQQAGQLLPTALTAYKIDIVQGNVVTSEQLAALQLGAPRAQVQAILGTPLMASPFHAQRWDYVFTIKRQGLANQNRRVTVFFKDDKLERIEADALPSESDFVGSLRKPHELGMPKPLEASDAALDKYPLPAGAQAAVPAPQAPNLSSYPPLEPAVR